MEELIVSYFKEIDTTLEKLSHKSEQYIANLPSWVLANRRITIGKIVGTNLYIIKAVVDNSLKADQIETVPIQTNQELQALVTPFQVLGNIKSLPQSGFAAELSDVYIYTEDHIHAVPALEFNGMIRIATADMIPIVFSDQQAKTDALNYWSNALTALPKDKPFMENLGAAFTKFYHLLDRQAFKERRIHRFINGHSKILLPNHKKHYFEHRLYNNKGEWRTADFILEREIGQPPLLIELESPHHQVFRQDGKLTSPTNTAREQIDEWVRFIDENPNNTAPPMDFLRGPKQRLIVIGRGLEHLEKMRQRVYTDTLVWTYDLLAQEAKDNWNGFITEQSRMLGIPQPNKI